MNPYIKVHNRELFIWVCSYVKVTNATCLCRSLVSFYEALPSDYGAYLDC